MEAPRRLVDDVLTIQGAILRASEYDGILRKASRRHKSGVNSPTIEVDGVVHEFECDWVVVETTAEYHRIVLTACETTGSGIGDVGSSEIRIFADGHLEF